ncbi:unnamed protein product [Brachionus calyciflorus]|uniref:EGF-like domain-containing protein n=1 Tax=Brachionus calyciflorus TaxID=104777 RepID=A0A813ZRR5_9BILA|nr:unnamed protein product [Brachionus calyciflorus]
MVNSSYHSSTVNITYVNIKYTIFGGSVNGTINVWDYDSNSLLFTLNGHKAAVRSIEYLPNNYLLSGDSDSKLFIWSLKTRSKYTELDLINGYISSIILINSTTFTTASHIFIELWSTETFASRLKIASKDCQYIVGMKYHLNKLFSISFDGTLKLWENFDMKFDIDIKCDVSSFEVISLSNLICGCTDGLIKIYSTETNSFVFIKSLQKNEAVLSLSKFDLGLFVAGGKIGSFSIWNYKTGLNLLTRSSTGAIRVWDVKNGTMIKQICVECNVYALKCLEINMKDTQNASNRTFVKRTTQAITLKTNEATSSPLIINTTTISTLETVPNIEPIQLFDLLKIISSKYDYIVCLLNCSNHGECKYDNLLDKFFCNCQENYYGSSCKLNIKPCSSNLCLNNGICVDVLTNNTFNYECQCFNEFYSGRNCEIRIDVCLNETCSNKGNCYDSNHTAKCKCFNMYSGDKCEMESSLTSLVAICSINLINSNKLVNSNDKNDDQNINFMANYKQIKEDLFNGKKLRFIFYYQKMNLYLNNTLIRSPNAVGGFDIDIFEYFGVNVTGNPIEYIASSTTALITHSRYGIINNYGKIRIYEDNRIEVGVVYIDVKTTDIVFQETFNTTLPSEAVFVSKKQ